MYTADDGKVYNEVKAKCADIPSMRRKTCFIIGGVPFSMAKQVRESKERYTILKAPKDYKLDDAKGKAVESELRRPPDDRLEHRASLRTMQRLLNQIRRMRFLLW